jgi:hypothetical protein
MARSPEPRWLLLMHQIPPHPGYLRVKIGRRLVGLGAVAVKNSIYVLPKGDQGLEDFQWVRREIVAGGGDASVCEARFVEGLSDQAVEALFQTARAADYAALLQEARRLQGLLGRPGKRGTEAKNRAAAALVRLRKRQAEVDALDFFGAKGRETLASLLAAVESALRPPTPEPEEAPLLLADVRGRTWVTRPDVHVDRMASAWLIRRFIDPRARFRFTRRQGRKRAPDEITFDMFEADFTHEDDRCTFEVLVRRFGLGEDALQQIAEIVHDIDLKDAKFGRSEGPGIDRLLAGLTLRHQDDSARLREGGAVFDALYESFRNGR